MPSIKDADGREYPAELHLIEWQAETKRMLYLCSENGFPLDQVETRFHVPSFSFSAYLKSPYIAALHNDGQLGLAGMVPELREALEGARNAIKEHFRERAVQRARSVVEPLAGRAQQTAVRLVGFLCSGTAEGYRGPLATFRQALNESGYYEGRNVMIEFRFAENQYDRLPALARDLVQRRVDVIVAAGAVNTGLAAKDATRDIPIVFVGGSDPVQLGLVSRPGGNVTAVTSIDRELMPKHLEILRELVPGATAVGLLVNPSNPNTDQIVRELRELSQSRGPARAVQRSILIP